MRPAVRNAARLVRPAAQATRALDRSPRLTIIGWHRIDAAPGGLSTPADVFLAQLDALQRWGAVVLPLDQAARLCTDGALPGRAVVLTLDDGYASVIETAWPLLKERGLPATLFVITGYLAGDRCLPWDAADAACDHTRLATLDEIQDAASQGLDIGSHTVTHRWLPHLDPADLEHELAGSRSELEAVLARPVHSVAYPMGGWNEAVQTAAARAGYRIGVTVDRGLNSYRQNPLIFRRGIAPDTVEDFELLLDGAYTWLRALDSWRTRKAARW